MLDEKTIYNYIDAGLLTVGNIDLPRKVRYRVRKKKTVRVDKHCHLGRTYEDYLEYMAANPDTAVVQMDSVEGRKGGKAYSRSSLLTASSCSPSCEITTPLGLSQRSSILLTQSLAQSDFNHFFPLPL